MSATGRGEDRYDFDEYETPAWCVHRFLEKVPLPAGLWIDPCAGSGALIRAVNEIRLRTDPPPSGVAALQRPQWHANEIQAKHHESLLQVANGVEIGDITKWVPHDGHPFYDVWISNPPYNLAQEVIEIGMQHARYVVMLLRINFLGSKKRYPWLSRYMPYKVAVLPDRPCFRTSKKTGKPGTDATEYAWFIWKAWDDDAGPTSFKRKETNLVMLNLTDPKVIATDKERIRLAGSSDSKSHNDNPPQDSPVEQEAT